MLFRNFLDRKVTAVMVCWVGAVIGARKAQGVGCVGRWNLSLWGFCGDSGGYSTVVSAAKVRWTGRSDEFWLF